MLTFFEFARSNIAGTLLVLNVTTYKYEYTLGIFKQSWDPMINATELKTDAVLPHLRWNMQYCWIPGKVRKLLSSSFHIIQRKQAISSI
jgi:hypothetical protein